MPPKRSTRSQKDISIENTIAPKDGSSAKQSDTRQLASRGASTSGADPVPHVADYPPATNQRPQPNQAVISSSSPPSSTRKPIQRLHSLHSRPPFSASAGATTNGPKPLKYQPKAPLRRNQAEREAQDKSASVNEATCTAQRPSSITQQPLSSIASTGGIRHDSHGGGFVPTRGGFRGGFRGGMLSKPARFSGGGATGHLGGGIPRSSAKVAGRGRGKGAVTDPGLVHGEAAEKTIGKEVGSLNGEKSSTRVKLEKDKATTKRSKSAATNRPRRVKKEKNDPDPEAYASGNDDGEETDTSGRKLNIDFINLLSDNEDDGSDAPQEVRDATGDVMDLGGATSQSPGRPQYHSFTSFRPVRLERQEHVERPLAGISAAHPSGTYLSSAELRRRAKEKADAQESLFIDDEDDEDEVDEKRKTGVWGQIKGRGKVKDVQVLGRKKVWKGAWGDNDDDEEGAGDVKIKEEPIDDIQVSMRAEVKRRDGTDDAGAPHAAREPSVGLQQDCRLQSPTSMLVDRQPNSEDEEPNFRSSSNGLAGLHPPTATSQQDSSTDSEGPVAPTAHRRRRSSPSVRSIRLQKPKFQTLEEQLEWQRYVEDLHLVGNLLRSGSATGRAQGPYRKDGTKKEDDLDTQPPTQLMATTDAKAGKIYMVQLPPLLPQMEIPQPTTSAPAEVPPVDPNDSTDANPSPLPREPSPPPPALPPPGLTPATHPSTVQAGKVGYLRLHASSRVTMTWGDMLFSLGRSASDSGGAGGGSLQEVVVLNYDDGKGGKEDKQELKAEKSKKKGKRKENGEGEGIFKIKIEDDGLGQGQTGDVSDQGHGYGAMEVDEDGDAVMTVADSTAKGKEESRDENESEEERGAWAIGEINGGFVGVPEWEGMFG